MPSTCRSTTTLPSSDRPLIELSRAGRRHTFFPRSKDVSFEVEKGETIGIIGQNGAGKSTLLKLLCGVTRPSSGKLETRGTIASILELGTGFHPEFSGRDNAALNAAILGLTPREVRERLPAILEFSELGSFLDRPVKTYSSGMYMRLAFSVAVNVNPDILVIDEALAVGDGHFQKKCVDKIREFQEEGKTILFCSHALYYVSLDLPPHAVAGPGTADALRPFAGRRARVRDVSPASATASGRPASVEPRSRARRTPVRFREIVVCDRSRPCRAIVRARRRHPGAAAHRLRHADAAGARASSACIAPRTICSASRSARMRTDSRRSSGRNGVRVDGAAARCSAAARRVFDHRVCRATRTP